MSWLAPRHDKENHEFDVRRQRVQRRLGKSTSLVMTTFFGAVVYIKASVEINDDAIAGVIRMNRMTRVKEDRIVETFFIASDISQPGQRTTLIAGLVGGIAGIRWFSIVCLRCSSSTSPTIITIIARGCFNLKFRKLLVFCLSVNVT